MKQVVIAILGSVLTALYWWIVFTIAYANVLFAGDRNPALQPVSDNEVMTKTGVTIAFGILVYALLTVLWQRLMRKLRHST